ncbi:MAG: hypothetical protein ABEJ04_03875 [Halobacteriaceae archaeon]
MYYALFPDGRIECADYDRGERGVELYDEAGDHLAFVPYENLHAILDTEADASDDDSPPFIA